MEEEKEDGDDVGEAGGQENGSDEDCIERGRRTHHGLALSVTGDLLVVISPKVKDTEANDL